MHHATRPVITLNYVKNLTNQMRLYIAGMERHSISLYTAITRPAYDAVPCKASVAAALNSITLFGFFLIMVGE